jgi:hypothetical protein
MLSAADENPENHSGCSMAWSSCVFGMNVMYRAELSENEVVTLLVLAMLSVFPGVRASPVQMQEMVTAKGI